MTKDTIIGIILITLWIVGTFISAKIPLEDKE